MDASTPLAVWGPPGFIIVVLAGVIAYLYKDNQKIQTGKEEILRETLKSDNEKFEVLKNALIVLNEVRKK